MKRALSDIIAPDLNSKMILLSGPRQVGKTTLSQSIFPSYDYLNFDSSEDRLAISKKQWDREKSLIIFDELHKMKNWKQWLKGIYDTEKIPPRLMVTGSAMLDTYKKVGDSMAGRYFSYRLHPLDLKELVHIYPNEQITTLFEKIFEFSGFPEPYLHSNSRFYRRWKKSHLDIILKQDLMSLYAINDIKSIETLVHLLKERVGGTISYTNLARDLARDPTTIKRWLQLLENLYIIFPVRPYSKKIARSLLKESKYYFYDFRQVSDKGGARLENLVACALIKSCHYLEDTEGFSANLYFVRTKDGQEIDFLTEVNSEVTRLIEVKRSDNTPSKQFNKFIPLFPKGKYFQLVQNLKRESTLPSGLEIRSLMHWLGTCDISN